METKPCIFKARFKYNPCRECNLDYMRTCENYLAEARYDILNRRKRTYSPQIEVEGKPMIPPTQKTSGNVKSVTADTNITRNASDLDICDNCHKTREEHFEYVHCYYANSLTTFKLKGKHK